MLSMKGIPPNVLRLWGIEEGLPPLGEEEVLASDRLFRKAVEASDARPKAPEGGQRLPWWEFADGSD